MNKGPRGEGTAVLALLTAEKGVAAWHFFVSTVSVHRHHSKPCRANKSCGPFVEARASCQANG